MAFRTDETEAGSLFAFSIRDLVDKDSDVWLYIDLFEHLDLREFDADYCREGCPGIEPKLMLRTIFYGLTHSIVSGRKLAEFSKNDNRFIVLSGDQKPNARSFQRFLVRHSERIRKLFAQVVQLAIEMKLASLGRVALDGSKFKAQTSKHKAMSYERMNTAVKEIEGQLETLRKSLEEENSREELVQDDKLAAEIRNREERLAKIRAAKERLEDEAKAKISANKTAEKETQSSGVPEPKAQRSFHDLDAIPCNTKNSGFQYVYNTQAAVDGDNQIILAATIHNCANDYQALPEILDEIEESSGRMPAEVLADAGYGSAANMAAIAERGAMPHVALGKEDSEIQGKPIDDVFFRGGSYFCKGNVRLSIKKRYQEGEIDVNIPIRACRDCPLANECRLRQGGKKSLHLPNPSHFEGVKKNRVRMMSEEGKAAFRRRKVIVEPVFGNIKNKNLHILHKGRKMVETWWKLVCTAHNIEKIVKAIASKRLELVVATL